MSLILSLLLLLGLGRNTISKGPPSPTRSPGGLEFELPTPNYETEDSYSPGPMGVLFQMVHLFLYVVQPHAFPEGILRKVIQGKFDLSMDYDKPESVVLTLKVILYEIGILICAALGLLFVIFMPLVGLCFGVCRSCNRCGGEMHQRQKRNGPFLKKYYAVSLLVICVFISIGTLYGFAANRHLRTHVGSTQKLADSNFRDLRTFLSEAPSQIDYVLAQYTTTKERAFQDLDNIKSLLGGRIQEQLRPKVVPVLGDVQAMAEEMKETQEALMITNKALEDLQKSTADINTGLRDVKTSLEQSLNDPTCSVAPWNTKCSTIRVSLDQLNSSVDLGQLPSLKQEIDNVNAVLQADLPSLVQKGYKSFSEIPERVQNQTTDIVSDVKTALNNIGSDIRKKTQQISFRDKLSNFSVHIDYVENYVRRGLPRLEEYDSYRWLGSLIVCCLLTLIVIFYYLGLLCGVLGYDPYATPIRRGCVSNTGGIFLMVGVGFSFLFCWILMIIVVLTFAVGGNVERLVCDPYQNRKLFKILDTPYLLNENWRYYLPGMAMNKPDMNITFEQVYSDCKDNKGLYTTFRLENSYNVSQHLSIQEYVGNINRKFDNMKPEIDHIVLLEEAGRKNLLDFSSSGVERIAYDTYLAETAKPLTKVDLLTFSQDMQENANELPPGRLKQSLIRNADKIRSIHYNQVVPLEPSMKSIHQLIEDLQQKSIRLGERVSDIVASLDSAQDFITNNISSVVIQESKKFAHTIIGYFEHYLEWVKSSITEQVAACKPLATALDSAVDVFLCNYIVKPMNLFWFGIGQATVLLLPALIFAVKLTKYYRRMDSEDVYEDVETIPMTKMGK